MKKLIALGLMLASFGVYAGATFSTNVVTTGVFIVPTAGSGIATVNYVLLSAPATQVAAVQMYDTPWFSLDWTNAQYSTMTLYASNSINLWTNYYGRTNYTTNVCLFTVSNNVAAANIPLTAILRLNAGTNSTVAYSGLDAIFSRGIMVSNSSAGTVNVTIGYTQ
jgi:hypothetical protein